MALKLQTIIFKKTKWTKKKAESWLKSHDFKIKRLKNYNQLNTFRYRQRPPSHFVTSSYRTKDFKDGIYFVFGKLKN